MSTPVPQNQVKWRVTSTLSGPDLTSAVPGAVVYTVRFTTDNGAVGEVTVPEARISDLAFVRSQIAAKAAQLDAVHTLTSDA